MKLKPGRELDALIAEKVMGCHPDYLNSDKTILICTCGEIPIDRPHNAKQPIYNNSERLMVQELRHYSTSIEAAWEVVEKFKTEVSICSNPGGGWKASFIWLDSNPYSNECVEWSYGDTAPLAICLAALEVIEHRPRIIVHWS